MADLDLDQAIERYHQALSELIKGNPILQKEQFSHQDDVCLANPFGPAIRGWERVDAMLDRVASLYSDAGPKEFERVAMYATSDLAGIVEIERARVTVRGREEAGPLVLRVTTIFRREEGHWKVVHRHADTITTPQSPDTVVQSTQGLPDSEELAVINPKSETNDANATLYLSEPPADIVGHNTGTT